MLFNKSKRIRELEAGMKNLIDIISSQDYTVASQSEMIQALSSTYDGKILLEKAEKECKTEADYNRLKLLKDSLYDINYRAYVTRDCKGELCIDIQQIPISDEEIKGMIKENRRWQKV